MKFEVLEIESGWLGVEMFSYAYLSHFFWSDSGSCLQANVDVVFLPKEAKESGW